MKCTLLKYFIFHIIIITNIIVISHSQEFSCSNPNVKDLTIKTDNHIILSSCVISEEWLDVSQFQTDTNFKEVYESPESTRRSFTLDYKQDTETNLKKDPLVISSISASSRNKDYLNPVIYSNRFPYTLNQGDTLDFIVEYNCKDLWDDLEISIRIHGEDKPLNLYVKKICKSDYIDTANFSYFVLICFYLIFMYFSRLDFLIHKEHFVQINIKELLQAKNVENIFYTTLIIIGIIIFFISFGYIYVITFIFSTLLSVICVKSLVKFIFSLIIPSLMDKLESNYCFFLSFKLTAPKIFCYLVSLGIYICWFIVPWNIAKIILNNFIVFIITYYTIHKINFKNFPMILTLLILIIIYQFTLLVVYDGLIIKSTNPTFDLTTHLVITAPIRFILPDLVSSPFDEIYFFSIMDLVLLGFILRYCEFLSFYDGNYISFTLYASYIGIIINLILFYVFKIYPPLYLFPCLLSTITGIIYAIFKGDVSLVWNLDKLKKVSKKELFDVPLGIIGADHSEDFANLSSGYIPPNVYKVDGQEKDEDGMNLEMNEINNKSDGLSSSMDISEDEKKSLKRELNQMNSNSKTEMNEIKDSFSFKVNKDK